MCNGKTTSSTQKIYCEYPSRIIVGGGYFSLKNSLGFHQEIRTAYKNVAVPASPAIPAMRTNAAPVSDYPYNSLTLVSGPVSYTVPYVDMCSHPTVYAAGGLFIAHISLQWGGYAQPLPIYCSRGILTAHIAPPPAWKCAVIRWYTSPEARKSLSWPVTWRRSVADDAATDGVW